MAVMVVDGYANGGEMLFDDFLESESGGGAAESEFL
jgi:hypothetical protein